MALPFQIPSYVIYDTHHFLWTFTNPPSISQVIKMINWSWHKNHSKFIHSVGNTGLLLPVCLSVMGILQARLFSWKASNKRKVLSSSTVHLFYFRSLYIYFLSHSESAPEVRMLVSHLGKLGSVLEQHSPLLKNNEQPDNHSEKAGIPRFCMIQEWKSLSASSWIPLCWSWMWNAQHTTSSNTTPISNKHLIQHIVHKPPPSCAHQAECRVY